MEAAESQRFYPWSEVMTEKLVNRFDPLPPDVVRGLTLVSNGATWAAAAESIGVRTATLRKWYRDPRSEQFIQEIVHENLTSSQNLLSAAAPRLAQELVEISLDRSVKPYSRINAIAECFKILQAGVIEAETRKQLAEVRRALQAAEDSKAVDV